MCHYFFGCCTYIINLSLKKEHYTSDFTRHFVLQEIGMIKGYKLTNETTENENIIMNYIRIEINLSSATGSEFYNEIKGKFTPEKIKAKYITNSNYVYAEKDSEDLKTIEIRILTDRTNPIEVKAKKKLLQKINKYT